MRILHLPTSVGGNSWGLRCAERAAGADSYCLITDGGGRGYDHDFSIPARKWKAARAFDLLRTFVKVRKSYDVYHFNFGSSLLNAPGFGLPLMDIPYYHKKAGLFVTYNGCDARQKYPTMERVGFSACHDPACYGGVCVSGKRDEIRRRMIEKMSRHVNGVFALNPDLLHFLPEKTVFLPYTIADWDSITPAPPKPDGKSLVVLHAPTDRAAKGSAHVERAVEAVNRKKPGAIQLKMVENVSRRDALKLYAGADVVIDQLLVGWYGALAVETLKMGKPVVCFIREEDLKFIPPPMATDLRDAMIWADTETLPATLERLADDRDYLRRKSRAGMEYANKWHDPARIAEKTLKEYQSI